MSTPQIESGTDGSLRRKALSGYQAKTLELAEAYANAARTDMLNCFNGRGSEATQLVAYSNLVAHLQTPAVPEWLPIETAPKDGRSFLITGMPCTKPEPEKVHWGVDSATYGFRAGRAEDWLGLGDHIAEEALGWYEGATHWMPLPQPPAAPKESNHG